MLRSVTLRSDMLHPAPVRHRGTVPRSFLPVALAVTALVGLVGCGSDAASDTTVAVGAAASTQASAADPSATSGPDTTAAPATDERADDGSAETLSPDASSECKELYAKFTALVDITSGALPSQQEIDDGFAATRAFVPDELKPDVDVFRDAYQKLATAVAAVGGDITKAASDPGVQVALQAISTTEVNQASQRVGDYLSKECPTG